MLVVDDQKSMRSVTSTVIREMGHDVTEAESGQVALDIYRSQKVDLMLLDVEMPGMDGFETARAIREHKSVWFPIIFLSAKTEPKFFVEGIRSGGDIYLYKPIVPEVLEAMVHAMERLALIQEELHQSKINMEKIANRDQLTGLINRRGFDNAVNLEITKSNADRSPLALILLDIDQFKQFNDTAGHQAGDECLKVVATILLKAMCRPADLVARYGGEEFAVLLHNTDLAGAQVVADRIVKTFEDFAYPHPNSSVSKFVTASGGGVQFEQGMTSSALLEAADRLLYVAKREGRNRIIFEATDS
ncbi:GGDEF domain-containing response regulator [Oleiphilus messinensis]|uniref:GGDEF domain-containing response regulator n=1 Tax=Oleiphilus messinensis TaxID=141451 RepID=UPI001E5A8C0C|nr:diguanylate cyclase [Oleiphilus messinensis]